MPSVSRVRGHAGSACPARVRRSPRPPSRGRPLHLAIPLLWTCAVALPGCSSRLAATLPPPGAVPPSPSKAAPLEPLPRSAAPGTPFQIPAKILREGASLTLAEVVSVALENNPATRASWLNARAAGSFAGVRRAPYFPTVDLTGAATGSRQASSDGRQGEATGVFGPALTLTYLLLDAGGRRAGADEAYWNLIAADWLHDSTIQNAVFLVVQSYYQYLNGKAQVVAARATLESARTNLQAATVRHDAGVATIADVLQAKTAVSQAELDLQSAEGFVVVFRGALATSMGLPANVPLDVGDLPGEVPADQVRQPVEALIDSALLQRPDLSAARAGVERAAWHVEVVRSDGLPALVTSASGGANWYAPGTYGDVRGNWSVRLLFAMPVFTGYASTYSLQQARHELGVAEAEVQSLEQQVILQVWTSYYALDTATRRLATSRDLLASSEESERVALGRYREGVGTIIDLLVAQARLADARAQEAQSRADWFTALARLARDTGAAAPLDRSLTLQPKKVP